MSNGSADQGRRRLIGGAVAAAIVPSFGPAEAQQEEFRVRTPELRLPADARRVRVAFGSCAKQSKPQPIWRSVAAARPDLFLFLGDNLYADARDAETLRQRYREFAQVDALQSFRRQVPSLAIWDDHDFGGDDAGADYPLKSLSQQLFCDAWGEPADSPRRNRDGVYASWTFPVGGRKLQVILTDLRFNRTPLTADPARKGGYEAMVREALASGRPFAGWYRPTSDPAATLLGERQWRWLEQQLAQPADVRILGSSVQFSASGTGWEGWDLFPRERERLGALLQRTRAEGLVVVSGDMHYADVSSWTPAGGYPIVDTTSSGLTEVWEVATPNTNRVSPVYAGRNFGLLDVDLAAGRIDVSVCDEDGRPRITHAIDLHQLRLPA